MTVAEIMHILSCRYQASLHAVLASFENLYHSQTSTQLLPACVYKATNHASSAVGAK